MSDVTQDDTGRVHAKERGALLMICIDRPAKRNGFTPRMFQELGAAYSVLQHQSRLRCAVLHAAGDHFSAGLDLPLMARMRATGQPYVPLNFMDPSQLRAPARTKPVVVAMQGICFTIALELALSADIVVASEDCRFGQIEPRRGVMAGQGGSFRLVERAGWGNAMRWLLTGEEFDAAEALRIGVVQEVVPVGRQLSRAIEIAEVIARQAPLAIQSTIETCRIAAGNSWQAAASFASARNTELFDSNDAAEGRAAFAERREAIFHGD